MIHRLIDMKTNDVVLRPIRSSLLILVLFSFYGRLTPRQLCCLVRMSSDEIGKQNKSYGHSCGEEEVIRFFCLVDEGLVIFCQGSFVRFLWAVFPQDATELERNKGEKKGQVRWTGQVYIDISNDSYYCSLSLAR